MSRNRYARVRVGLSLVVWLAPYGSAASPALAQPSSTAQVDAALVDSQESAESEAVGEPSPAETIRDESDLAAESLPSTPAESIESAAAPVDSEVRAPAFSAPTAHSASQHHAADTRAAENLHPSRETRDEAASTIQRRYATKVNTLAAHILATAHFRGDFYNQIGFGVALLWYPSEELGIELRGIGYYSWLNDSARQLRRDSGYLPDTRARQASLLAGARVSIGYGKVQIADGLVMHFDPQVVARGGITFAEDDRYIPTVLAGLALLLHFDYGLQAQVDLMGMVDVEDRGERGTVTSIGFAPSLSFGWHFDYGRL